MAVNQPTKVFLGLAQITELFIDLLKKEGQREWKEKHDLAFEKVEKNVQEIIKVAHFNQ